MSILQADVLPCEMQLKNEDLVKSEQLPTDSIFILQQHGSGMAGTGEGPKLEVAWAEEAAAH